MLMTVLGTIWIKLSFSYKFILVNIILDVLKAQMSNRGRLKEGRIIKPVYYHGSGTYQDIHRPKHFLQGRPCWSRSLKLKVKGTKMATVLMYLFNINVNLP